MPFFDPIRIGASGADTAYEVERSLRFNKADDVYLTRTPSSTGNQKVWTFSAWIKRTNLNNNHHYIYSAHSGSDYFALYIKDDKLHSYFSPGNNYGEVNSRLFRDVAAWFHIVHQVDAANTTQRIWINNVELSLNSGRNPSNSNFPMNESGVAMVVGNASWYLNERASDMYLAEVHYSDGNKYEPSDFAKTNSETGQWVPKSPSISYGTNGFYLNFSNNSDTTTTTLGKDESGNSNNFTPNNFSVSAGTGNDSLTDTPTNNFCTLNPLDTWRDNSSTSDGNLKFTRSASNFGGGKATFAVKTGKWYFEVTKGSGLVQTGFVNQGFNINYNGGDVSFTTSGANACGIAYDDRGYWYGYTGSNPSSISNGDIIGVAFDADNFKFYFHLNGTYYGNGNPSTGSNGIAPNHSNTITKTDDMFFTPYFNAENGNGYANFGQRPFSYTIPTGYKTLSSANLPDPTILLPNKHFDTLLWSGYTADGRQITGLEFQPDLIWWKVRNATYIPYFVDSIRGIDKQLRSDDTAAETNYSERLESFLSNGFTIGTDPDVQQAGKDYVAWNWNAGSSTVTNNDGDISSQVRANTTAGFSIVAYTGNGTNNSDVTIGHGLGVAPDVVIIKARESTSASQWIVWHKDLSSHGTYTTNLLFLNTTSAENYYSDQFKSAQSTTFTIRTTDATNGRVNQNNIDYISYCFSEVSGYSKFGSYTGNNNSDGPFVYTGFRPAWIMMKSISTGGSATYSWPIFDSKRSSYNIERAMLRANTSDAENSTATADVDILSNGFKPRYSPNETNGPNTYIYLAFAEFPFKYARAR
tara:strand:- start:202 stop:2628 length:2427 start_codon:yes stop_codon:yes gene_type:complete